jgi:hypothetical protein
MTTHEKRLTRLIRRVNIRQDTPTLIMIIAADANHLWACRAIVDPTAGSDGVSPPVLKRICSQHGWQPSDLKKKLLPAAKALGIIPAVHACDYYQLIGVNEKATPHEIKKAFRQRAFSVHPDTASNSSASAESFQELLDAYRTLHDPMLRKVYDANRQRRWREYPVRLKPAAEPVSVHQWYLGGLTIIFIILLFLAIFINEG